MRVYVYGIPNCDQVKKTLAWLKSTPHEVAFHNFKVDGISSALLERWFSHVPWESLLNKRGTTWRNLGVTAQQGITDQLSAQGLMLEQPSIIKRPVIEIENDLMIGFNAELLAQKLNA